MPRWLPYALVAVVIAVLVPWWAVILVRERDARQILELYTPFGQPVIELRFAKKANWDPQTFLGAGRRLGFWEWSPQGVVLTEKGKNNFGEAGDEISGKLIAGKRRIDSIISVQPLDDRRKLVRFKYVWIEVFEPALFLNKAPETGKPFEAEAEILESGGRFTVKSITDDFWDKGIDLLQRQAKGARF